MNETEKRLLDAAVDLAVQNEFEEFINIDTPQPELPSALDKRIRTVIRRKSFARFVRDNIRIAAICLCVMVVGIGTGVPLYVDANTPEYHMLTDQEMYRETISVQFLRREKTSEYKKTIRPRSAAEVLDDFTLERTYSTEAVYVEEYDGVRYEQTSLHAEGQYVIPTKGKNIRNIIIGEYTAVLVFDPDHAAIVWRDDTYSYMLEGKISGDDAMRYARLILE